MLSQENQDLTFRPVVGTSPYAARYTSTSPGHTMSPEGIIDNISVFERLSLAAQQKLQNEEKARELAKKGLIFLSSISLFIPNLTIILCYNRISFPTDINSKS